jgi:hypothetical protein
MWTTLKNAEDWAAYQIKTAKGLQILPERVSWGTGPNDYPCLVCSLFPPRPPGTDPKAYSAFVYQADCEELFAAAGRKFLDRDAPVPANQAQFNRWVAAQQLAIVHFMVETGICKKEQFEDKLLESIELVDEYTKGERDKFKDRLTSSQITVLDTLEPPK